MVPSLSRKFIRLKWPPEFASLNNIGTKLDMLLKIAKLVDVVIILEIRIFYPKILDFMQE